MENNGIASFFGKFGNHAFHILFYRCFQRFDSLLLFIQLLIHGFQQFFQRRRNFLQNSIVFARTLFHFRSHLDLQLAGIGVQTLLHGFYMRFHPLIDQPELMPHQQHPVTVSFRLYSFQFRFHLFAFFRNHTDGIQLQSQIKQPQPVMFIQLLFFFCQFPVYLICNLIAQLLQLFLFRRLLFHHAGHEISRQEILFAVLF